MGCRKTNVSSKGFYKSQLHENIAGFEKPFTVFWLLRLHVENLQALKHTFRTFQQTGKAKTNLYIHAETVYTFSEMWLPWCNPLIAFCCAALETGFMNASNNNPALLALKSLFTYKLYFSYIKPAFLEILCKTEIFSMYSVALSHKPLETCICCNSSSV